MDATPGLNSLGHLAGQLQTPVQSLLTAAEQLGIRPATRINGTPFFDSEDSQRIADRISHRDQPSNAGR